MSQKEFIDFVVNNDIHRHANLITIENRKTKELVAFFHSGTTEESEQQLQNYLDAIIKRELSCLE